MPRPGWYRDPERTAAVRWWDGESWTAWQSDSPRAPYPPPGSVESVPARPSKVARRAFLGGTAAAAAAVGLTAYGMTLDARRRGEALAAGKPDTLGTPGSGPQEGSDLVLDPENRVVRWSRLFSAVLPGAPYELSAVTTSSTVFTSYVSALQTSDVGWTNKATWWPSSVIVGVPRRELVDPVSLSTTAGSLLGVLRDRVGTVSGDQDRVTTVPVETFPGREAQRATTTARYDGGGRIVTSGLRVTVVQAHPLAHIAWFELLQDAATPETAAALHEAYDSIWVA